MSALPKTKLFTADAYLALEEPCEYRSQFYNGEIFAMAGASMQHNRIAGNAYASLHTQLRKRPCDIFQNDMRVKVNEDFFTYPDIVIVCGEPKIEKKNGENLLNPTVLIEVLSPSTERFDRGEKFRLYRMMPSLKEYILISQDKMLVEYFVRNFDETWTLTEGSSLTEIVKFPSIEYQLNIADIYEKVDFDK